jgi:actin-related protein
MGSLYASACVTGLVVDSGDGVICTIPVYEGYSLPHAVAKLYVVGRDIIDYLIKLLLTRGYNFPCMINKAMMADLKKKICLVTVEPEKVVLKKWQMVLRLYKMPDGNVIQIADNMCQMPKVLFAPDQLGIQDLGLPKMVCSIIMMCDTDIQDSLFAEIVLTGGNTLSWPGRKAHERTGTIGFHRTTGPLIKITASPDRCFSAWTRASVITCMRIFRQMWVTAEDLKGFGKLVVHRKGFQLSTDHRA